MVLLISGIYSAAYGSEKQDKPSKPTYQYSFVPKQQCSYCNQETLFVPCTPCALTFLADALKKYGQYLELEDDSSTGFNAGCLGECVEEPSGHRKLDVGKILTSTAVADIVRFEKLEADSKKNNFSIKLADREAIIAAVSAQKIKSSQKLADMNKNDSDSDGDLQLKTVLLTPQPTKKTVSTAQKKPMDQGCCSSCVIL